MQDVEQTDDQMGQVGCLLTILNFTIDSNSYTKHYQTIPIHKHIQRFPLINVSITCHI